VTGFVILTIDFYKHVVYDLWSCTICKLHRAVLKSCMRNLQIRDLNPNPNPSQTAQCNLQIMMHHKMCTTNTPASR